MTTSTYNNQKLTLAALPAIEYNFYPYDESTRRQLTFTYSMESGGSSTTNSPSTGRWRKPRSATLSRQTGHAGALGQSRPSVRRVAVHPGRLQVPAVYRRRRRNTSLQGVLVESVRGASRIRNQIYLPAEGATDEEVLLRLRQIATGYDYGFSVGFSYTFGSVFNNVVNARLSAF